MYNISKASMIQKHLLLYSFIVDRLSLKVSVEKKDIFFSLIFSHKAPISLSDCYFVSNSLSPSLYFRQSLSVNLFQSVCLFRLVSVSLSLSVCLCQYVHVSLSFSVCLYYSVPVYLICLSLEF